MTNKPIIRFNEYSDEWEEITLSDIAEIVDRKTDEQSNAPVMMISAASGFINQSEKYSTDNAGSSLKNYILLKKGELAYNHGYSALRNFGSCFTLEKEEARIPFVYHCFSIPSQNPYFYGYYLNCGIFDKQLRKLVASTARMDGLLNISFSDYTSIKVNKPSKDEQKEIAIFIKNINTLINSTQEKLEKAIILKKSMIEKMFPQNDAKIPELRFKGFSGEYENISTLKIFEVINDKNHPELPVLSASQEYGMVYRNETGGSNISYNKNNQDTYKRILPGQFAIHLRSFQGGFAHSDKEGICSPAYTIMSFIDSKRHDQYYWKYLLTSDQFIKRLEIITYGIRDGRTISFEDFSTFSFYLPTKEEQKKIGSFFVQMDSLIYSYRNELEKLKTIKKSLLEKMFV